MPNKNAVGSTEIIVEGFTFQSALFFVVFLLRNFKFRTSVRGFVKILQSVWKVNGGKGEHLKSECNKPVLLCNVKIMDKKLLQYLRCDSTTDLSSIRLNLFLFTYSSDK